MQNVSTATAVIAVAAHDEIPVRVEWGETALAGELPHELASERAHVHAVSLAELLPDTQYSYRARTGAATIGAGAFRTAPLAKSREIVFAVIGDSGAAASDDSARRIPGTQREVVRAMLAARPRPEIVLHTGDVVYPRGAWRDYEIRYFVPFRPLAASIPVYPAIGNHDVRSAGGASWLDAFVTPVNNEERSER